MLAFKLLANNPRTNHPDETFTEQIAALTKEYLGGVERESILQSMFPYPDSRIELKFTDEQIVLVPRFMGTIEFDGTPVANDDEIVITTEVNYHLIKIGEEEYLLLICKR